MSAFLCSPYHIGRLASWRPDVHSRDHDPKTRAALLARANLASVAYRYDETDDEVAQGFANSPDAAAYVAECQGFAAKLFHCPLKPIEVLKAIRCLNYQSCELEDWRTSAAHEELEGMTAQAINRLPGFDDATGWTLEPVEPSNAISILELVR